MKLSIFIGIPATGKSTFFAAKFSDDAIRLNLDMLRTRHRESILFDACLRSKTDCVIDNTNPTQADRQRYIRPAREAGYEIEGYFFQSVLADAIRRNSARDNPIPEAGIRSIAANLELPEYNEGFDALWYVSLGPDGGFEVEPWRTEQ